MSEKSHYAKLESSPRLQRLLFLLCNGREYTTLEIVEKAKIVAVNSAISELRANGIPVNCRRVGNDGTRIFCYQLAEFAEPPVHWDGMAWEV